MDLPFSAGFFQIAIQISIGILFCCALALVVMLYTDIKNKKLW